MNKAAMLAGITQALAGGMYEPIMTVRTSSSPIYTPTKHKVMSYAKQNKLAKKRRNNKQKRH